MMERDFIQTIAPFFLFFVIAVGGLRSEDVANNCHSGLWESRLGVQTPLRVLRLRGFHINSSWLWRFIFYFLSTPVWPSDVAMCCCFRHYLVLAPSSLWRVLIPSWTSSFSSGIESGKKKIYIYFHTVYERKGSAGKMSQCTITSAANRQICTYELYWHHYLTTLNYLLCHTDFPTA